ncbi:MAG: 2-amino-4-hydroxy-6-hydroxymethyldihydropteridine diphosphokinase, partial [Lentisphaeria bacterium]
RPIKHSSRESRIIDLDILLFGNVQIKTDSLIIPHPRMLNRRFVLEPLAEIAGDWIIPGEEKVSECLKKLEL